MAVNVSDGGGRSLGARTKIPRARNENRRDAFRARVKFFIGAYAQSDDVWCTFNGLNSEADALSLENTARRETRCQSRGCDERSHARGYRPSLHLPSKTGTPERLSTAVSAQHREHVCFTIARAAAARRPIRSARREKPVLRTRARARARKKEVAGDRSNESRQVRRILK